MIKHITTAFDEDLRDLRNMIRQMGNLVETQITGAIDALVKRDLALARGIIAADDQVDALQRRIEDKAVLTIARRQPMALDLRETVGAMRTANDLERIGDLAENIAKRATALADQLPANDVILQIQRMVALVLVQLRRVLHSYMEHEVEEALDVWRRDEEVDAMNSSLFRELLTYMMENTKNITFSTHLLFCAKNIERIGDHVTNIAETVYYIVRGSGLTETRPKADVIRAESAPVPER